MSNNTQARLFELMTEMGHEQLVFCNDAASGYHVIIAMHSTKLGPRVERKTLH